MFLNSLSAIADLKLKLLIMGCEHFSDDLQSSKLDDDLFPSHRKVSSFYYFIFGPLGLLLTLGAAAPAWSNSAPPIQRLPQPGAVNSLSLKAESLREPASLISSQVGKSPEGEMFSIPQGEASTSVQPLPGHRSDIAPALGASALLDPTPAEAEFSASTPLVQCWKSAAVCSLSPTEGTTQLFGQAIPDAPSADDGELGELRVRETEPLQDGEGDPELGTLRVEEIPAEPPFDEPPIAVARPPRQPSVYLLGRVDYFRSSNVFTEFDPVNDGLLRAGLTLFYAPALGPKTFLITSIDANSVRYDRLGARNNLITNNRRVGSLNYDEMRFRVGIFQRLSDRMSGEIGWTNQRLFQGKEGFLRFFSGKEFFNDNAFRLELSRQDPLGKRLSLNTFYQFRWSLAGKSSPTDIDRDRIINTAIASLSYSWSPSFQTALDYQYAWTHFTRAERDDHYHQLVGRLTYTMSPRTQLNVFSGFSFGNSTDRRIDFGGFIFGAGFVFNAPLF